MFDTILEFLSRLVFSSFSLGKKYWWITLGLVILLIVVIFFAGGDDETVNETVPVIPLVTAGTVAEVGSSDSTKFVGTVRSVSEADIQAERGGRVTSVPVKVGDNVSAGSIIATLENSAERAVVLQAEGAYEAVLAQAEQSGTGLDSARTTLDTANRTAVNEFKSAYATVANILVSDIDIYFSNPDGATIGLRIQGFDRTSVINNSRTSLKTVMQTWQTEASRIDTNVDTESLIDSAKQKTNQVIALVDELLSVSTRASDSMSISVADRQARITALTGTKNALLGVVSGLDGAKTGVTNAKSALKQAEISASGAGPSVTDAQIKQALGNLRGAQANLAKTILRSPISGQIEVLRVQTGDFLSPQTSVARVANKSGLLISIFVGQNDLADFALGEEVKLDGNSTGTVVSIAPAIDSTTQKTEIKISTASDNLTNGSTVSVSKIGGTSVTSSKIEVPITAIKFADKDGSIFVIEDNKLKAVPVEVGTISGSLVTILSGLDADTVFVFDARGRSEGETVEVRNK